MGPPESEPTPAPEPTSAAVAAARWALISLFGVTGLTLAAWLARMPAVRDALDVSPSQLGGALLVAALSGFAANVLAPPLVVRLGAGRSIRVSALLFAVSYAILGVGVSTGSLALVMVGLGVHGVAFAGGNLPINVASTEVERRIGRPILPQFHAAFSIGTVLGSLLGAAAAGLGVSVPIQLAGMAVVAVAWRYWATRYLLPEDRHTLPVRRPARAGGARLLPSRSAPATPRSAADDGAPSPAPFGLRDAWRESRTLFIGVVVIGAAVSEVAANDWLALAVVDGFATSESFAAAGLSVFVAAMTVGRLLGSVIIARLGRARTLRVAALVAASGVVTFVTAPGPALALVGAVAWGAGSALNFPIAISAASDDPARAAYRVSVVSACASGASMLSPLLIGGLAESVGIRSALLVVAVALMALAAAAGRATAPLTTVPRAEAPGRAVTAP